MTYQYFSSRPGTRLNRRFRAWRRDSASVLLNGKSSRLQRRPIGPQVTLGHSFLSHDWIRQNSSNCWLRGKSSDETWFRLKWHLLLTLTEPPRILQPRQDRIANGSFDFPFCTSNGIKASWRLVPIRIETFSLSTSRNSTWRKCDNCFTFMRGVTCLSGIVRSRTAHALPTVTYLHYWFSTGAIWKSIFTPSSCLSLWLTVERSNYPSFPWKPSCWTRDGLIMVTSEPESIKP